MARQKGIFLVHGSIGNVRNYQLTGDRHITSALKGGPSGTQIQTLPSLLACKNHNREWKGQMKVAKDWMQGFSHIDSRLVDKGLSGRVVACTQRTINEDTYHDVGYRNLYFVDSPSPFWYLIPNIYKTLDKVFDGMLYSGWDYPSGNCILTVQRNDFPSHFNFKGTETHVRITLLNIATPDWAWYIPNLRYDIDSSYYNMKPMFVWQATSAWLAKSSVDVTDWNLNAAPPNYQDLVNGNLVSQISVMEFGKDLGSGIFPTSNFGIGLTNSFQMF